jgi:hypothetical protein
MSLPTLTLTAAPDPAGDSPAQLRDRLALSEQAYGDLLAAARATLAAAAGSYRYDPLLWLREHLSSLGALPAPGAKPTDFVPDDDPVWGPAPGGAT